MTKDVLVQVKGIQSRYDMPEDAAEVLEQFTKGMYYEKNGKQYLFYEEYLDEELLVKTSLKIEPGMITMTKKGALESAMVFVPGEKTNSMYQSPAGTLELSCNTERMTVEEQPEQLDIILEYVLEINQSYVSDNRVEIRVKSAPEAEE